MKGEGGSPHVEWESFVEHGVQPAPAPCPWAGLLAWPVHGKPGKS